MESVPLANLLADIAFVQKWWFNPRRGEIKLYELDFKPIRWVPDKQAVEQLIGPNGRKNLKALINAQIQLAKNRTEIAEEGAAYRQYQAEKLTLLSGSEKEQIYPELILYIKAETAKTRTGRYGPSAQKEKAAMILKFPTLASKITGAKPLDWSDLRSEAIRRMS